LIFINLSFEAIICQGLIVFIIVEVFINLQTFFYTEKIINCKMLLIIKVLLINCVNSPSDKTKFAYLAYLIFVIELSFTLSVTVNHNRRKSRFLSSVSSTNSYCGHASTLSLMQRYREPNKRAQLCFNCPVCGKEWKLRSRIKAPIVQC